MEIADRLTNGLEDAEFTIPGQIVADIQQSGASRAMADGSVELSIEALTVQE
jgi:hypothetical protein